MLIPIAAMLLGVLTESANAQVQNISINMCLGLGFEFTSLPSPKGYSTQDQIYKAIEKYESIAFYAKCSADFRRFLCNSYMPLCARSDCYDIIYSPCKSLCQSAQYSCGSSFDMLGFPWPNELNCDHIVDSIGCLPALNPVPPSTTTVAPQLSNLKKDPSLNSEIRKHEATLDVTRSLSKETASIIRGRVEGLQYLENLDSNTKEKMATIINKMRRLLLQLENLLQR